MRWRAFVPYLALTTGLVVSAPAYWPVPYHLGDTFLLWSVGRMILGGVSPYEPSSWAAAAARDPGEVVAGVAVNVIPNMVALGGVTWPYPPWTGLLFAPFAALPVEAGTLALHLSYVAAGGLAAIIATAGLPWRSTATRAVALAGFGLFQPFVMGTRAGQFGTFLLLGVALVTHGLTPGARLATPALVVGALLVAAKPHVALLFVVVVLIALVRRRRVRALAVTSLALAVVAAASLARFPESISAVSEGASSRASVLGSLFATTWTFARVLGVGDWRIVAPLLIGLTALAAAVAVRWSPPVLRWSIALSLSLPLSLAISPYVQSYDDVLLAPAAFVALAATERVRGGGRVALALAVLVVAVAYPWLAIVLQMIGGTQASSGLVPLLFAPLLAAGALAARRAPRAGRADP